MSTTTAAAWLATTSSAPIRVERIDHLEGFTALRAEWTALLRASAADNPFLTWEWLHAWWMHLRGTSGLRVLAVRAGEELIAIAPLLVAHGTLPWFSRLELMGSGYAGSDYLDVIARRGSEATSLNAIGRFLESEQLALRLTHLPTGSLAARLCEQLAREGWTASAADGGTCPVVPLAGHSWDSYLATLGSSHRANFRRRLKALGRQFAMRFDRVTTEAERRQMLGCLAAFHDQRWDERGGSTAFLTPAVRAFQNEATQRALEGGWLRMYVLRLNDAPAAVMYGFFYGGRFYFYQHGFDSQYKEHSVGLVLMGLTIRAAIEEGAREFDMLWGVEPYKFLWAQDRRLLERIDLFPAHIGGRAHHTAVAARRAVATLTRRLRSTLDSGVALPSSAARRAADARTEPIPTGASRAT